MFCDIHIDTAIKATLTENCYITLLLVNNELSINWPTPLIWNKLWIIWQFCLTFKLVFWIKFMNIGDSSNQNKVLYQCRVLIICSLWRAKIEEQIINKNCNGIFCGGRVAFEIKLTTIATKAKTIFNQKIALTIEIWNSTSISVSKILELSLPG